jgi:hypothetical protein
MMSGNEDLMTRLQKELITSSISQMLITDPRISGLGLEVGQKQFDNLGFAGRMHSPDGRRLIRVGRLTPELFEV